MTDRNNSNLPIQCKDIDGIPPIRKEAWGLQAPLPSTSGNQLTTNFGSIYGVSSPAESTLPFGQYQHTHLGHVNHERRFPLMVPIFCYSPYCHQCQHFIAQYYH